MSKLCGNRSTWDWNAPCRLRFSWLLLERGGLLTRPQLHACMERTGKGKGRDGALLGRGLAEFDGSVFDGRNE